MKVLTLSEFRAGLSKARRLVQLKRVPIAVTHHHQCVGVLVNLGLVDGLKIARSEEAQATIFRAGLTEYWERIQSGDLDCVYLMNHDRRVAAFVSHRIAPIDLSSVNLMVE